ncbi:MAG: ferritin [Chloroflexaceae bacterium]|nr:ferritin [Chloroflexaceae bacterium]
MLSQALQDIINDQIAMEMHASLTYLSMAAYFEANNLEGCAHWMRLQSSEEQAHAMKFFEFLNDRGARVRLQAIGSPPVEFESPLTVFEKALEHEQKVTAKINQIYTLALKENDYPTQVMLHWFIEEQVEEEKSASQIIELLKMTGGQPAVLLMLDRQLAARGSDH